MTGKTVVVIGAGPSGMLVTKHLTKRGFRVVLVTNVEYYYFLVSMPRVFNEPVSEWVGKMTQPIKEVVPKSVDLIVDDVVDITETSVRFKTHEEVPFDAVVVATGSVWPDPIFPHSHEDRTVQGLIDYYESAVEDVDAASKVAIVGAGSVGLEIAGELAHKYKNDYLSGKRSLTIYHAYDEVLDSSFGPATRRSIRLHLKNCGVKMVLGTRVVDGVVSTTKEPLDADLVYYLTGPKANPPPISIPNVLDERGQIKVDDHLHAKGRLFALGDVCDFPRKLIQNAKEHSQVVSTNIEAFLKGEALPKKIAPMPKWEQGAISLGPEAGYGQIRVPLFGYLTAPQFAAVKIKSEKMLTDHMGDFF